MQASDLKRIRTALGLSQDELGEMLDLSRKSIMRLEAGDVIDKRTQLAVAQLALSYELPAEIAAPASANLFMVSGIDGEGPLFAFARSGASAQRIAKIFEERGLERVTVDIPSMAGRQHD